MSKLIMPKNPPLNTQQSDADDDIDDAEFDAADELGLAPAADALTVFDFYMGIAAGFMTVGPPETVAKRARKIAEACMKERAQYESSETES